MTKNALRIAGWMLGLGLSMAAGMTQELPGQTPTDPVQISFEEAALSASGLTPGGEVVVHGIARQREAYFWRLIQRREIVTADPSGVVRVEFAEPVDPMAVWTVVDTLTGAFEIAAPDGFRPTELAMPVDGLGHDARGAWQKVKSEWSRTELLYVRPAVGAWWLVVTDGALSDLDGNQDDAASVVLDQAQTLWGVTPPPTQFAAGDVAVAVNLDTLDFYAVRLVSSA